MKDINFRIWADTIGDFIFRVQLLAFNYKNKDKKFSEKLNVPCDGLVEI